MEFVVTQYKHCDLIEITGRIDSYTSPNINDVLKSLIMDNHLNIIIDLNEVSYISSSGILVFVNAQKQLIQKNQGKISFTSGSELILSSFKLAGFDQLFQFFDDPESALEIFRRS
jgi:anti-sigma B factor antagonist